MISYIPINGEMTDYIMHCTNFNMCNELIESLRKEADYIPDDIQIDNGCPFCLSSKEGIALIEESEGFGTPAHSYCHCTVCGRVL